MHTACTTFMGLNDTKYTVAAVKHFISLQNHSFFAACPYEILCLTSQAWQILVTLKVLNIIHPKEPA